MKYFIAYMDEQKQIQILEFDNMEDMINAAGDLKEKGLDLLVVWAEGAK